MKEFFDTSVLVSAFWRSHAQHEASLRLFANAKPSKSACAVHTLAELYATMTALPVKDPIHPDQAYLLVEQVRERCTVVTLTAAEYCAAIEEAASRGFTGGRIYDALLL